MPESKLTPEELAELEALEKEESDRAAAEAVAIKRQHLDALRMTKRFAGTKGKPGLDFAVLETTVGNIAIRRPFDVEIDTIEETADRGDREKWVIGIVLEPSQVEMQKLFAEHAGLCGTLLHQALDLVKVMREEDAKK